MFWNFETYWMSARPLWDLLWYLNLDLQDKKEGITELYARCIMYSYLLGILSDKISVFVVVVSWWYLFAIYPGLVHRAILNQLLRSYVDPVKMSRLLNAAPLLGCPVFGETAGPGCLRGVRVEENLVNRGGLARVAKWRSPPGPYYNYEKFSKWPHPFKACPHPTGPFWAIMPPPENKWQSAPASKCFNLNVGRMAKSLGNSPHLIRGEWWVQTTLQTCLKKFEVWGLKKRLALGSGIKG